MAYQLGRLLGTLLFPLFLMVLLGSINYFLKQGRITFRQALFARWVVISSLVLTALGLLGQLAKNLPTR